MSYQNIPQLIFFITLILSGLGYIYKYRKKLNSKIDYVLDIPLSFFINYAFISFIYFILILLNKDKKFEIMSAVIVLYMIIGIILFFKNFLLVWKKNGVNKIYNYNLLLISSLLAIFIILPQIILGNLPYIVSDSWSHISIVNRLFDSRELVLNSFSLPNERYGLYYSPHHAFFSIISWLTNSSPLNVFISARIIYPVILTLSFLAFFDVFKKNFLKKKINIIISIIFFILLFDTTDAVWRGSADYRIPAFIIMFLVLREILIQINNFPFFSRRKLAFIIIGILVIAVTHAIELMIIGLMIIPFAIFMSYKSKSKEAYLFTFSIILSLIISSILALMLSREVYAPLTKNVGYFYFVKYYYQQLNVHMTVYTVLVGACLVIFQRFIPIVKSPIAILFFQISLFSSIIFGPLNPIFFPFYDNLIGSSHSNRTMYSFPLYVVIIYFMITISEQLDLKNLKNIKNLIFYFIAIIIISSVSYNFYKKAGLDGVINYKQKDVYSQLNLYPSFYKFLTDNYRKKIIISDTFTSAPINAITNNYIFTHRPWTGGVDNRFMKSKEIMKNPLSEDSIKYICFYNIDIIAINFNNPPNALKEVFTQTPWLMSDFKVAIDINLLASHPNFLYMGAWDGIEVYEIDREILCQ